MNPILPNELLWIALPAAALLGAWLAWRSTAGRGRGLRILLATLRCLAILAAGLALLNFGSWRDEREQREGVWAILLDRSASMAVADAPGGDTRWAEAVEFARQAAEAAGDSPPRFFTYGTGLEAVTGEDSAGAFATLVGARPDASASDLPAAGRSLLDQLGTGGALSGILVIGDGRQVGRADRASFTGRARAAGAKVLALTLGSDVPERDLIVRPTRRQYIAFPGSKLSIGAEVQALGIGPVRPVLSLADPDGKELARSEVEISETDGAATTNFEITAGEPGYYRYRLSAPPIGGERHAANNSAEFGVNVIDGEIAVFTAEGAPYWDSKFLIQLLRGQPNVRTTSVYRLAEDRFFQVESGDEGARESESATFPEDLGQYDLLVFGKGSDYFLDSSRVSRLKAFVRDGGGAVIFARGKPYSGSFPELEALEPVVWGEPLGESFRFTPTAAGAEAGLFGHHLAAPDSAIWPALPELIDARRPKRLKAFAQTLAEGVFTSAGRERRVPVVVNRRFGRGTVTTVNADGLWKWDFIPGEERAGDMYAELWHGLVLWSVTHSEFLPGQAYSLRLSESAVDPDTPVRARVAARDATETKTPDLVLVGADGSNISLQLRPDGVAGNWSAVFTPGSPGEFSVQLADTGVTAPLSVRPPPAEGDVLSADPDAMAEIAEAAGGRAVTAGELADAIKELLPGTRKIELADAAWEPGWDRLLWLLPVLGLLFGEWILRRRNGLL